MKKRWSARLMSLCLCLCLLPVAATAQEEAAVDDSAVTRARYTLDLDLHADAFPADGQTDFQGWEALFKKLSLRGFIDTQRFLTPLSRVYMESELCLNGEPAVPFTYEGYWNYRYLRSKALLNQSIHFQMDNFLEFTLKPYYYMGLCTQYLGLLLYPEATAYLLQAYGEPLQETLANSGTGSRSVSYVELYELCEQLDAIATDDDRERVYFYLTALLVDFQASDATYDSVSHLEDYLDFLDPQQEGMTIVQEGAADAPTGRRSVYTIGETTVFTAFERYDQVDYTLTLPNQEGFLLTFEYHYQYQGNGCKKDFRLAISDESDVRLDLNLNLNRLPNPWEANAAGSITFTVGGSSLLEPVKPIALTFTLNRGALEPPYETELTLDWIHPDTHKPAVSLRYNAKVSLHDQGLLQDRLYDNLHDFFHLNEDYLEECKREFTLPLTLTFAPILLETPPGVINDVLRFLDGSGFLASLGIE